ncbi:YeeE/YedE family protein [Synechococcus sp. GreenBA-s]|nr:YeeE/YedE family protein [Synechococcus sp. GreenBA-s]
MAPAQSLAEIRPARQSRTLTVLLALVAALAVGVAGYGWRQSALALVGVLFGISLYHASFGFASSYRQLLLRGDGRGVLAQVLMLSLATLLFAPLLISGVGRGAVAPLALQAVIGAFVFGIGMQLGSGCACGTLYTIGGGSAMMLLTLVSFSGGSFAASLSSQPWSVLPRLEPVSLLQLWGWGGAGLQLLVLAAVALALWRWQRPRLAEEGFWPRATGWRSLAVGPWSLVGGAVSLALLNGLTVVLAGRPWGVTRGFTLWAAKLATLLGWNPDTSPLWSQGPLAASLQANLFADVTSVMNLGIVLGAALAAALAGRLSVRTPPSAAAWLAALLGGLMMGYGAWLAFGCNVGAYFSGIASTSLHGWLWITCALLGTAVGVRLRPWFGLPS